MNLCQKPKQPAGPSDFRVFKKLGFRVVLSPQSTRKIYELGIDSIPSESECYPAKLAHGHISWLIHQNVDFIFYPAIPYERNEFPDANNHYNCPIVTSYSENIKNNVEEITSGQMRFLNPFMAFTNEEVLSKQLVDCFKKEFHIPEAEVRHDPSGDAEEGRRSIEIYGRTPSPRYRAGRSSIPC